MRSRPNAQPVSATVRDGSLKYTLFYACLGSAWILVSDTIVYRGGDARLAVILSILKGLGYVVATSLLLYWMMRRNARGLRRAAVQIAAGEARFRGLFEIAQEGLLVFGEDMKVNLANQRMAEMLGCTPDRLIGVTPSDLMSRDDAERFGSAFEPDGSGRTKGEWWIRLSGGPGIWVSVAATWFDDPRDGSRNVMAMLTDIGAQKATEARIRDLNVELESRVKERTRELELLNDELASFSYTVSHDLRAPLRAVHGYCRAISEDYGPQLDPGVIEYLDRMTAASVRMGQLIDGLLDLSKASRTPMVETEVDLSELAESIVSELRMLEPNRSVETIVQPGLPAKGDARLLREVVQNLIQNSWKFTAQNPEARIEFGAADSEGERVYFVRDNGVGFDQAYADKLFQPFQRLHRADEFAGEGIGLATVHRVVQRHGGRVWAEGREGEGAVIRFTLGTPSAEVVAGVS